MENEKRRSIRIRKPLAVQFGVKTDSSVTWDISLIKDISEHGICLRTAIPLKKDDVCYLRLRMPTRPVQGLELTGKVIESFEAKTNIYVTRLEFLNLDEEQKQSLREYIAWALVNERGGK